MNRLQTFYEQLQLPVKTVFIGCFMISIGALLSNPYVNEFLKLDSTFFVSVSMVLMYSGGLILSYFPLYIFIKLIAHRSQEQNIVLMGVVAFGIFTLVMTLLSPSGNHLASYSSVISFTLNEVQYAVFKTGALGIAAVYFMVRYVSRPEKKNRNISQLSHLGKEVFTMINVIVGAILLGVAFSYIWPYVIDFIYSVMNFIASDVNNPMSLFAYGGFERLLTMGNLDTILHQEMWLGPLGGSWMNLAGKTFLGDVNIWAAQLKETVNTVGLGGAGRFTTVYYVLNIFAIPAYLLGLWSTITNKKSKNLNLLVLTGAILVSMISGILLPVELMLLLTAPVLYIFHIFMVSFISAVLSGFGVTLGFSFMGSLFTATPGSIIDLIALMRNPIIFEKIMILLLVGLLAFITYFFMTRFYYRKMAIDVLNIGTKQERIVEFVERLGGLDNIEAISSTPTRVHVNLYDRDKINVAGLHRQGVTRIVETRSGFILSFGSASYIVQNEINNALMNRVIKEDNEE